MWAFLCDQRQSTRLHVSNLNFCWPHVKSKVTMFQFLLFTLNNDCTVYFIFILRDLFQAHALCPNIQPCMQWTQFQPFPSTAIQCNATLHRKCMQCNRFNISPIIHISASFDSFTNLMNKAIDKNFRLMWYSCQNGLKARKFVSVISASFARTDALKFSKLKLWTRKKCLKE